MEFQNYQNSDAKLEAKELAIKSNITIETFKVSNLLQDIKLVLTLKDELKYGGESIILASYGTFGLSKFPMSDEKNLFFGGIFLYKISASD